MGHSLVRMVRSSCRIVALFALLSMVPAAAGAGTVYYDSDYSSYNTSSHSYVACDYTPGNGDAYGVWTPGGGGANNRVDTAGNPSCNGYTITPTIQRHRVCQARPLSDPCSSWLYE